MALLTDKRARPSLLPTRRQYYDECATGQLDIPGSVSAPSGPLPPLLIIHGDADTNVPVEHGVQLHDVASGPKRLVIIPKANHLLTNTNHLKKALREIVGLVKTGTL